MGCLGVETIRTGEEWDERVSERYKGNKKLFRMEMNGMRKKKEGTEAKLKDGNEAILVEEENV